MANVATMGPPPSPKEPRRSGRRPAASSSKSPAGSPPSEATPKPKDPPSRPSLNTTQSNGRNKRAKNEDIDEPLEELPKNAVNGNGGASRSKRKGKEKEKMALVVQIPQDENQENVELVGDDGTVENGEDEEESGVTRCICEDEGDQGEFMAQCEECKAWQHGVCMGYADAELVPQHYFCEQCKPELWTDLIEQWAVKRARQSSTRSHPPTTPLVPNAPRSSRSHSPTIFMKAPKRRNTMNSRDAAYEESVQALIEATKSEAISFDLPPRTPVSAVSVNGSANGHAHPEHDTELVTNPKKKRKRIDDDAASVKRTRSTSITSDRPPLSALAREPTPQSATKAVAATVPTTGAARTANARNKRNAGRKSQAQEIASAEGDEAGSSAPNRRQASNHRAKANNASEHHTRRGQANAGASASGGNSAASRAYHNSHAYVVSQQSLFTSWNLPDYLAHLEPMLPTDIPRPLEVRGSVLDGSTRDSQDRTTERGVKVKWPSKRMSVGDMNKRVRSLVEWVGREQAGAMERMRRKEALQKVLRESRGRDSIAAIAVDASAEGMDLDPVLNEYTVPRGSAALPPDSVSALPAAGGHSSEDTTMKMMEELMEELIGFQERFGPGAKLKERDRRAGTL
ncbi:hypothetical protein BC628DRAFT_1325067 [Trametes gibbosa]|nr:hypothetical protein BC628DRAFT_1325067 [Trametes gibbosa]